MRNLIRAEFFRVVHSGFFKWFIVLFLCTPLMAIFSNPEFFRKNLSENFILCADGALGIFIPIFICIVISFTIGASYKKRTSYYEVMHGYSICKILVSKLILYVSVMTLGIMLPLGIYFGIIGAINGIGIMNDIPLRMILMAIIIIHISIFSVLMPMITKSFAGTLIAVLRLLIIDETGIVLLMLINNSDQTAAIEGTNWFVMKQFMNIFCTEINSSFITAIITTLVFESILWIVCAYISFKHKNFK